MEEELLRHERQLLTCLMEWQCQHNRDAEWQPRLFPGIKPVFTVPGGSCQAGKTEVPRGESQAQCGVSIFFFLHFNLTFIVQEAQKEREKRTCFALG